MVMERSGFVINQTNRVRARVSATKSELRLVGAEGRRRWRNGDRTVRWWRRWRRECRRRLQKMVVVAVITIEIRIIGQLRRDMSIP